MRLFNLATQALFDGSYMLIKRWTILALLLLSMSAAIPTHALTPDDDDTPILLELSADAPSKRAPKTWKQSLKEWGPLVALSAGFWGIWRFTSSLPATESESSPDDTTPTNDPTNPPEDAYKPRDAYTSEENDLAQALGVHLTQNHIVVTLTPQMIDAWKDLKDLPALKAQQPTLHINLTLSNGAFITPDELQEKLAEKKRLLRFYRKTQEYHKLKMDPSLLATRKNGLGVYFKERFSKDPEALASLQKHLQNFCNQLTLPSKETDKNLKNSGKTEVDSSDQKGPSTNQQQNIKPSSLMQYANLKDIEQQITQLTDNRSFEHVHRIFLQLYHLSLKQNPSNPPSLEPCEPYFNEYVTSLSKEDRLLLLRQAYRQHLLSLPETETSKRRLAQLKDLDSQYKEHYSSEKLQKNINDLTHKVTATEEKITALEQALTKVDHGLNTLQDILEHFTRICPRVTLQLEPHHLGVDPVSSISPSEEYVGLPAYETRPLLYTHYWKNLFPKHRPLYGLKLVASPANDNPCPLPMCDMSNLINSSRVAYFELNGPFEPFAPSLFLHTLSAILDSVRLSRSQPHKLFRRYLGDISVDKIQNLYTPEQRTEALKEILQQLKLNIEQTCQDQKTKQHLLTTLNNLCPYLWNIPFGNDRVELFKNTQNLLPYLVKHSPPFSSITECGRTFFSSLFDIARNREDLIDNKRCRRIRAELYSSLDNLAYFLKTPMEVGVTPHFPLETLDIDFRPEVEKHYGSSSMRISPHFFDTQLWHLMQFITMRNSPLKTLNIHFSKAFKGCPKDQRPFLFSQAQLFIQELMSKLTTEQSQSLERLTFNGAHLWHGTVDAPLCYLYPENHTFSLQDLENRQTAVFESTWLEPFEKLLADPNHRLKKVTFENVTWVDLKMLGSQVLSAGSLQEILQEFFGNLSTKTTTIFVKDAHEMSKPIKKDIGFASYLRDEKPIIEDSLLDSLKELKLPPNLGRQLMISALTPENAPKVLLELPG